MCCNVIITEVNLIILTSINPEVNSFMCMYVNAGVCLTDPSV